MRKEARTSEARTGPGPGPGRHAGSAGTCACTCSGARSRPGTEAGPGPEAREEVAGGQPTVRICKAPFAGPFLVRDAVGREARAVPSKRDDL